MLALRLADGIAAAGVAVAIVAVSVTIYAVHMSYAVAAQSQRAARETDVVQHRIKALEGRVDLAVDSIDEVRMRVDDHVAFVEVCKIITSPTLGKPITEDTPGPVFVPLPVTPKKVRKAAAKKATAAPRAAAPKKRTTAAPAVPTSKRAATRAVAAKRPASKRPAPRR